MYQLTESEHDAAVNVKVVLATPSGATINNGHEGLTFLFGGHAGRHGGASIGEIDLFLIGKIHELGHPDWNHVELNRGIEFLACRGRKVLYKGHVVLSPGGVLSFAVEDCDCVLWLVNQRIEPVDDLCAIVAILYNFECFAAKEKENALNVCGSSIKFSPLPLPAIAGDTFHGRSRQLTEIPRRDPP